MHWFDSGMHSFRLNAFVGNGICVHQQTTRQSRNISYLFGIFFAAGIERMVHILAHHGPCYGYYYYYYYLKHVHTTHSCRPEAHVVNGDVDCSYEKYNSSVQITLVVRSMALSVRSVYYPFHPSMQIDYVYVNDLRMPNLGPPLNWLCNILLYLS